MSILELADYMFASLTDSTPPGSAFTSEPNPPGSTSSRLLRAEGNIEGVLRVVPMVKQVAQQEVDAASEQRFRTAEICAIWVIFPIYRMERKNKLG